MSTFKVISLCLLIIVSKSAYCLADGTSEVPSGLWRMGDGTYFSKHALIVDKAKKKLYVMANSPKGPVLLATYDSDLGKKPGDKISYGDYKTPEGIYFFGKMLQGSGLDPKLYGRRAFVTDYPNFWDRTLQKRGSGIWLHAIDEKTSLERGSKGCVVVRNDTIMKLSEYIQLQLTPMIIYDKVTWITPETNKSASEKVLRFLEKWKQSWQSNDLQNYGSFYAEDFKGNRKMRKNQWMTFKKSLAEQRSDIAVALSMPAIYEHQGNLIVRFLQDYKSTAHQDFGEKVLFLRRLADDSFNIVGEEWQPATTINRSVLASTQMCCQVPDYHN